MGNLFGRIIYQSQYSALFNDESGVNFLNSSENVPLEYLTNLKEYFKITSN